MKNIFKYVAIFFAGMTVAFFISFLLMGTLIPPTTMELTDMAIVHLLFIMACFIVFVVTATASVEHNLNTTKTNRVNIEQPDTWTGWKKDGTKCPSCGSDDTEEIDVGVDEVNAGQMHCKSCGFKGEAFLY